MLEAWLLFDETAIKSAAGNRRYHAELNLPALNKLESVTDPKSVFHSLLSEASDLNRRRQRNFREAKHARNVTEFIKDFSPLRQLSAFAALEQDIRRTIQANSWRL